MTRPGPWLVGGIAGQRCRATKKIPPIVVRHWVLLPCGEISMRRSIRRAQGSRCWLDSAARRHREGLRRRARRKKYRLSCTARSPRRSLMLSATLRNDVAKWGRVVKDAGIKID
jgi:hypothetical protein